MKTYESLHDHLEDVGFVEVWEAAVDARDVGKMAEILKNIGYDDPTPYINHALKYGLHGYNANAGFE